MSMPQHTVRRSAQRRNPTSFAPRLVTDDGMTWDRAVDKFITKCRSANVAESTIENYQWYLAGERMRTFLADHAITLPEQFDDAMLTAAKAEWFKAGVASGTVDTFHRIVKNFLGFAIREGYGPDPRVLDNQGPKLEQREPDTFTDKEIAALRAHLAKRPRDLMLVNLMLATGLRLAEVCEVTLDDIMEGTNGGQLVRVRQGKGRKDRAVPLDTPGNTVSAQLVKFINKDRPKGSKQRALFLTGRRDGDDYQPLTASAVQTLFKRVGKETGIHLNPHKFRHTFATRALSAGVDVMALQKALGHTTLAMVSRYVHYQSDDLLLAWSQRRD